MGKVGDSTVVADAPHLQTGGKLRVVHRCRECDNWIRRLGRDTAKLAGASEEISRLLSAYAAAILSSAS